MVTEMPYVPYLWRDIVQKTSAKLSARPVDPFTVLFDYGIYGAVADKMYKAVGEGNKWTTPLVWLVMTYGEDKGRPDVHAEASFELFIAMPSLPEYTSEERTELVFKPRLFPVYVEILNQLERTSLFQTTTAESIEHTMYERHYWGGGENRNKVENLFKHHVDAIQIKGMKLKISKSIPMKFHLLNSYNNN